MQTQLLPTSSALRSVAVDKQDFRDAMARLGSAVNIITTDGPAGRAGFTASAVCSVTDAPYLIGLSESLRLGLLRVSAKPDFMCQYVMCRT